MNRIMSGIFWKLVSNRMASTSRKKPQATFSKVANTMNSSDKSMQLYALFVSFTKHASDGG